MSHFTTLVLLPPALAGDGTTVGLQLAVEHALERYDEGREVPCYHRPCWCVGRNAQRRAEALADAVPGYGLEAKRQEHHARRAAALAERGVKPESDAFWEAADAVDELLRPDWEAFIAAREAVVRARLAALPDRYRPDPACQDCKGTGWDTSTYNPQSKWDWWALGGRWTGALTGYEPEKDQANYRACTICGGSGKRDDDLGRAQRAKDPAYTCNGCQGTGKQLRWNTEWQAPSLDALPVGALPPAFVPFALVLPDGSWHEQGDMGWWGVVRDEKTDWATEYRRLIAAVPGEYLAVLVDCHI